MMRKLQRSLLALVAVVTVACSSGPDNTLPVSPTPDSTVSESAQNSASVEAEATATTTNDLQAGDAPSGDPSPPETPQVEQPPPPATTDVPDAGRLLDENSPMIASVIDQKDTGIAVAGNVFEPTGVISPPPQLNIELVLDASGSMAELMGQGRQGAERRIDVARRSLKQVISSLPAEDAQLNIGFRVFGEGGGPSEAQKPESCAITELLVPVDGVDHDVLNQQVDAWQPNGWTPIDLALQAAGDDLPEGENVHNLIILVTDGEETCGGDPAATAAALTQSAIDVRIDVVGFALGGASVRSLREISRNGQGRYFDAQDGEQLASSLEEAIEAALSRSSLRLVGYGPDGQIAGSFRLRSILNEFGDEVISSQEMTFNPLESGDTVFKLPPGTYRVVVELFEREIREGLAGRDDWLSPTAILEAGQETVVAVGYGQLILVNEGLAADAPCRLNLELELGDEWIAVYRAMPACVDTLMFDSPVALEPGNYRLVDTTQNDEVILDGIEILPGRTLTVALGTPGE